MPRAVDDSPSRCCTPSTAGSEDSKACDTPVSPLRDSLRMSLHPALEDYHRRQRVEPGLARTFPDRHVAQPLARFEARQPLVEQLDADAERLGHARRELPRATRGRAFA